MTFMRCAPLLVATRVTLAVAAPALLATSASASSMDAAPAAEALLTAEKVRKPIAEEIPAESPAEAEEGLAETPAAPEEVPVEAAAEAEEDWLPGDIGADIALVSDYVDRGITNSDHNPAVQGSILYSLPIGVEDVAVYGGFWGSNVDFDDGGEATVEIDWLFGVTGTVPGTELAWDIGAAYYTYPGADRRLDYDYWEMPLVLSYPVLEGVSLTGSYYYSPKFAGDSGQAHYVNAAVEWEIPVEPVSIVLSASTGHQWIADNDRAGVPDYQDWRMGIGVTFDKLTFKIEYTDSNLSENECFGGTNLCESRAVFSVAAGF
jgi:uncharacterized protein (TIGR02001 family)